MKIFPYIKSSMLTCAEKQLYHFMTNNLCMSDKIAIFPKVRLADIVDIEDGFDKYYFFKIANRHVDFVICDRQLLNLICVVELDDFTHLSLKNKERDTFLNNVLLAAHIPLVRVKTKIKNISLSDIREIDYYINRALAPNCPFCGDKMLPRQTDYGHRFFACKNINNSCKYIINIDGEKLP